MGGEGSMANMIAVLKANKALLNKRLNYFDRNGRFSQDRQAYENAAGGKLKFKEVSKEELAKIRASIIQKKKRERLFQVAILSAFVPLVIWLFVAMFSSVQKSEVRMVEEERSELLENAQNAQQVFGKCIKRGDQWFQQYEWRLAVNNYRIALKIFPTEPMGLKKLGQAYTYGCINGNVYCVQADSMMQAILSAEPGNEDFMKFQQLLAERSPHITESFR